MNIPKKPDYANPYFWVEFPDEDNMRSPKTEADVFSYTARFCTAKRKYITTHTTRNNADCPCVPA